MLGLGGADAQKTAIDGIRAGPEFAALNRQGEEAILANASATGGLRGGNTQSALATFRADTLAKLIEQQFGRVGQVTQVGQNAAGMGGNAIGNAAAGIAQLLGAKASALGGAQIAKGNVTGNAINTAIQAASVAAGF